MNLIWLLVIFVVCSAASLLLCGIAKNLFPTFRSGEHKPGTHRPDMPAGGREIKTIELPLVGGPALTLAIIGTGIWAGFLFQFSRDQWTLLLIGLGALFGYTCVGFVDDWKKVYSNEGLSEIAKFAGVFLVSVTVAVLYFFLLANGQESYSFYKDLPILNQLLCNDPKAAKPEVSVCQVHPGEIAYYAWFIFFVGITAVVGSLTSLSVDFSDGLDGLAGGLVFSASLGLGIVVVGLVNPENSGGIVLEVLALLCAGGVLGFLPWNWPSSWAARHRTAKRRAKVYMGDSGALGLGGMLAIIAIFSRNEWTLLMIGGAFVMEGLSVVISARVLTRLFRRKLTMLRFSGTKEFIPHTEFPLPFLATPLHHHFDLLGWDRRKLVYSAWALGACFALLGVASTLIPSSFQRYIIRILILILAVIIWSSGTWTKCYFVGTYPDRSSRRSRLALFYGYPYRFFGINLYHLVEVIEASEDVIETPAEELALYQRMTIFDARSMLGLYCYRAGYYPAALAQWTRIPERNRVLRPEIARLLVELDERMSLEQQETQPMRRDQILQTAEPILTGNLAPADLPNPHEPIRSEETTDGHTGPWMAIKSSKLYPINNENGDGEENTRTAPLRNEMATIARSNGHNGKATEQSPQSDSANNNGARTGWISRLRPQRNKE
ncbi:UDP-N-acetylmuramyl pentapeptide phosphotransferase/UDP-N-acetylglucosamine-1-phosphate transferase [Thermosporothrix hazakensis]|jgi:UDP-N-acetylmuramyl pentapeptide phosphotransferase/UDP-N-acetylglucosamine-1-phosphate transferase|uniref:UDP-N-acetylmuramyl pentapeptide phosphotransferase/UDP-N-acetylglucosamine-1-phosphate transferase n=2 Tax=Thermosporothrix TaxID=768650 RepID=A0A326UBY0_THEHA|nr:hypothetical protein [Thermosporothrix hazakensis]PZW35876.1 UDP-N-acetylmuramyl pentapeptide phosphotransferase/UDP-N-acetylglucosamine-1-phosphate transferase [Thermosporothrix hazakensis]BBH88342.1 hypothetical protein KTC_30930 [Thermosporothrix sp. COM3]GCE46528.1 hypothetical protein KTH_13970 [Thermosporothrix hazakensis]